MDTTITLPEPLFEAAERLAKELGISRSELYATALTWYLETRRRDGITEALNRVYESEPSELDPVVAALQSAALPREEE